MAIWDDINNNADDAHDLVGDQFTITQNWATTMMNETLSFLNALTTSTSFTVPDVVLQNGFPTAPTIGSFNVSPPGEFSLSYTTPTRPTVSISQLEGIFLFSGNNYSSDISDDILSKIETTLQNGGTGLGSAIEEALFARARVRKEARDAALYTEAEDYFAERGWTLPTGMLSGRLLEIQKAIAQEDNQIDYEITIKQAELADVNTRHNLEQAIAMESMLRTYYINNELKNLEVSKATSLATVQEFTSNVEAAKLDIAMYDADIRAMISLIDAQTKAYLGEVQAYQTRADAYKSVNDALASIFIAEANVSKIDADIQLAEIDAELRAFLGSAQIDAAAAEASARVSAQIAAGAMSAVNAGVSFSYGASQSASASDNYSETHSYDTSVSEILHSYE